MIRFLFWKADLGRNVRLFKGTRWTFTGITLGQYGFGVIRLYKGTTLGVDYASLQQEVIE